MAFVNFLVSLSDRFMVRFVLEYMTFLASCLIMQLILIAEAREKVPPGQIDLRHCLPCQSEVDFNRDVAPIFKERCLGCHGSAQQLSGLRLDNPVRCFERWIFGACNHTGEQPVRAKLSTWWPASRREWSCPWVVRG